MQQEFPHVKADATRTNDGHPWPRHHLAQQHVQIRHHIGAIHTRNARLARHDAGCQHHVVKTLGQQLFAGHTLAQLQRNTGDLQAPRKVAQRLRKLFFSGHLHGDIELAAHTVTAVKQGYVVTALGGYGRGRQARRTCADHGDSSSCAAALR